MSLTAHYSVDQISGDAVCWADEKGARAHTHHTVLMRKLNRQDHWDNIGIDIKDKIKMYLTDVGMRTWVGLIRIATGTSGGLL